MTQRFATTPFGGGRMTAAIFQHGLAVERRRASLSGGGNDTGRADKWQLLRALTESRAEFAISDRTIVVLEALLSFHGEREIDGSAPIIVFPSNTELSVRTRGMADATLRRHLAALVQAGMILRRDSPNGKRYARRGAQGTIDDAFGFDLSPLALMATTIYAAAEETRAYQRLCRDMRSEISLHIRDTAKMIEAGIAEKREGDWIGFTTLLAPLARRIARQASLEMLEARRDDLVALRARVEKTYVDSLSEQEMSGNDVDSERHYQNSKPDTQFENSSEKELKRGEQLDGRLSGGGERPPTAHGRAPETKGEPVPLGYVLAVCPTLASYARDGISNWKDVVTTAGLVRSMLGISPDAWKRACEAMGELAAAITVAAILERADVIRSAGGYLRALTERAEEGRFSLRPMLSALEKGSG
jgi:replication initiation protein RepC